MLRTHLADLYQDEPRALVQSVKRNIVRFPVDFMFQLSAVEFKSLKSQIVTSSWGGLRRAARHVFTEQGVAMLSSVLKSKCAIQGNIPVIRTVPRDKPAPLPRSLPGGFAAIVSRCLAKAPRERYQKA